MSAFFARPASLAVLAGLGVATLSLPPLARPLEASLFGHMLVQLPLLLLLGALMRPLLSFRGDRVLVRRLNRNGLPGVVLSLVILAYWMLPRALDQVLVQPAAEAAKFISVPLAGALAATGWRRLGFVARSFIVLNAIAMFVAEGWLFLIAPERLCNAYLLDEQARVGQAFLVLAGGLAALVVWAVALGPLLRGRAVGGENRGWPVVPVAFFGMILGVDGLGNCWRVASRLWGLPGWAGESVLGLGAAIWATLLVLYLGKWLLARAAALAEFRHPIQSCYVGLVFVTTLLTSVSVLPYSRPAAVALAVAGWTGHVLFSGYITGTLWRVERSPDHLTAVLYLPTVAGNFVSGIAAGALGWPELGTLFLGAGLISWLSIESVLFHQLYTLAPLPHAVRPTLGIQLAPPVVCCVAWLAVNGGAPDTFAQILFGYGLLQAVVMIRLVPWFATQPFAPGHWAFSFGVVALPLSALRMLANGIQGPVAHLALPLFAAANAIIGYFLLRTGWLLVTGRLVPPVTVPIPGHAPAPAPAPVAATSTP